jgi:hypothetical protein
MDSVMAGLVPAIHVLLAAAPKDVDARHKAGHDESAAHCTNVNARGKRGHYGTYS